MPTLNLTLFSLEVFPSPNLFDKNPPSGGELAMAAIRSRPRAFVRKDIEWRIANVDEQVDGVLIFKVGRINDVDAEGVDEETGDFIDLTLETAISTWAIYDSSSATLAVSPNFNISREVLTIAKYVAKLIEASESAKKAEAEVEVSLRREAIALAERIRSAKAVQRVEVTFGRRNAFNASDVLHAWKGGIEELGGKSGKASAKADQLDKEKAADVIREAGERGQAGSATFVPHGKLKPVRQHIGDERVVVPVETIDGLESPEERRQASATIRDSSRTPTTDRQRR
jgi:hypothetical protein